jgi:hypothetical protein
MLASGKVVMAGLKLVTPVELAVKVGFPVFTLLEIILLILWQVYAARAKPTKEMSKAAIASAASKARSFKIAFWVFFPVWLGVSGMRGVAYAKERVLAKATRMVLGE